MSISNFQSCGYTVDKTISCLVISILIGGMDKLFPNDGWFLVFYPCFSHSLCCAASSIEAASIHGWPNHPAPERHIADIAIGKLNGSNRNPRCSNTKIKAFFGWRSCDHVMSASFEFALICRSWRASCWLSWGMFFRLEQVIVWPSELLHRSGIVEQLKLLMKESRLSLVEKTLLRGFPESEDALVKSSYGHLPVASTYIPICRRYNPIYNQL